MTTAEMLASVEAQIRKDIPRLMELREGCKVLSYKRIKTIVSNKNNSLIAIDYLDGGIGFLDEKNFQIIGHDIMLNDVLEWLNYIIYEKCIPINDLGYSGMVKQFYIKGDDGSIIFEILDLKNPDLGLDIIRFGIWNLPSIYLKDQSERVIKFLYNLIKE